MAKAVYSLVLSEDVVAEIDRLAYQRNTNRSNMINQILAEYVSYVTPEQRMRETFRRMEAMLTGSQEVFQLLAQPSDTALSLRSALSYKYNPTIRYVIELYPAAGDEVGELRVSLRTQNNTLLLYLMQFYRLWTALEQRYIGGCVYQVEDGKFARRLYPRSTETGKPVSLDSEALGEAISTYLSVFDSCIKTFFYRLDDPNAAAKESSERYAAYLKSNRVIL